MLQRASKRSWIRGVGKAQYMWTHRACDSLSWMPFSIFLVTSNVSGHRLCSCAFWLLDNLHLILSSIIWANFSHSIWLGNIEDIDRKSLTGVNFKLANGVAISYSSDKKKTCWYILRRATNWVCCSDMISASSIAWFIIFTSFSHLVSRRSGDNFADDWIDMALVTWAITVLASSWPFNLHSRLWILKWMFLQRLSWLASTYDCFMMSWNDWQIGEHWSLRSLTCLNISWQHRRAWVTHSVPWKKRDLIKVSSPPNPPKYIMPSPILGKTP